MSNELSLNISISEKYFFSSLSICSRSSNADFTLGSLYPIPIILIKLTKNKLIIGKFRLSTIADSKSVLQKSLYRLKKRLTVVYGTLLFKLDIEKTLLL